MAVKRTGFRKQVGAFRLDRLLIAVLVISALGLGGRAWLEEHPQHNPLAPLDLSDPPGWATARKLAALRDDADACRAVLERSDVGFEALPAAGDAGPCRREDRTVLLDYPLSPDTPAATCAVDAGLEIWLRQSLQPAARELFQADIERVEHLGVFGCRRLYGNDSGPWSEHATGNAIDIAGFTLSDGTRINVLRDWSNKGAKGAFLRRVRDGACGVFSTTLSPDYNAAHADHFHLDQGGRAFGNVCR
ncbi:extensin family protein [Paraurantiacibacter namhicola]|uniref:Extensin-like C-terminal domain-containing protein n=1 Tax=Paraurantiacibacter namhicola TaxID=645517 RepID=A0A1C7D8Q6_9SPHN|nr:extensin family protein [Paraurantiacibacter namhicola]ANU07876.1 hypothetical protein A6F65_01576 [Paraurantiacibacter namhicola]